uniref:Reverse transcriptase zinc-binding domain-containing protein n=1 Tax=Fagus sylvatica TaxID=28930 RepID=A0A2N9FIH8_FAGSY
MGGKRSFRIESKRFDLSLNGQCVEENIVREKDQAFVRTHGENRKTYVSQRCSNDHGRYLDIAECGRGGSRGRVVIPEGRKQSGWRGFGKELQLLLSPDHNNGHGPQQESRQNRSVGDGVEKPWYNGDLVSGEKGLYTYAGVGGTAEFIPPPWSQVGVFPPLVIPNSDEPTPNLVTRLFNGVVGRKTEPTGSQLVSTGLELVLVQNSELMVVQPISMVCPLVEDNPPSTAEPAKIGFYQNPPSDWVVGQIKAFGELVGASYEGYEEEVITLLQKIELRRPQPRARAPSQHRGSQSASRGLRELRGLASLVNYDSKAVCSHGPIIEMSQQCLGLVVGGKSPFRFENMWLKVEGFVDWVGDWWASYSFPGSLSHILARGMNATFLSFIPKKANAIEINFNKSKMAPVDNVPDLDNLATILGCKIVQLPINYLGLPLGAKFKSKTIWDPIVEKMERKLSGWQRMYLSKRGGGGIGEGKKFHLINWHVTTREVHEPHGVILWKHIRKDWGHFARHVHVEVGDGAKTRFWTDIWCGTCSLKDGFPELYRIARNKEALVMDHLHYHNDSVSWDLNFTWHAQDWELDAVASFLELLSSSSVKGYGEDRICWRGSSKEGFQVRNYCKNLLPSAGILVPWKKIWKTNAPLRLAFFFWVVALGCILTTDNLRRRHVIVLDWCCMSKESGESISHLLLHCSAAMEIWSFMFSIFGIQWVMPGGMLDLLSCWGDSCHNIRIRKLWAMVPPCMLWCIWWERNSRSFEGKERNLMEVKGTVLRTLLDWSKAARIVSFSSVLDFLDYCIA